MRVIVIQKNPDYPLVWVHADESFKPQQLIEVEAALAQNGYSMMGAWELKSHNGWVAPALKEDEHVKPRTKRKK